MSRSGRKIRPKRRFSEELERREEAVSKRPRLNKDIDSLSSKADQHLGPYGALLEDGTIGLFSCQSSCSVQVERLQASILELYSRQQHHHHQQKGAEQEEEGRTDSTKN